MTGVQTCALPISSAAHITIAGDGRPMVTMGAVDLSGTRTTMAQVVAEEFGLPLDDIHIHTGDSKSVGYSDGAAGSRVARTTTAALVEACADALGQLRKRAAEKLQRRPEDLDYAAGRFHVRDASGPAIALAELMQATLTDGAVVGRGSSTKLPLGVEIGAHVCDVEVDPATGRAWVVRYTAIQDAGRAIHPSYVEGQYQGGVAQGIGWALNEDGTLSLTAGTPDIGGLRASLCMMAAEELKVPLDKIRVQIGDTGQLGYNFLTGGSRATFSSGMATVDAAREVMKEACKRAAKIGRAYV